MSKYMSFESEAFATRELLVEALKEMGFENITEGSDLLLQGWDKREQRLADVVIRRETVTGKRLLGDIGFQKTSKGYVAVVDDMDLDYDRLNVLSLNTVPLREQKEKICELVIAGLEQERIALNRRNSFQLESSVFALLENYTWTGNFRELNNFVLKLAIEHLDAQIITKADIEVLLAEKEINVDIDTKVEPIPDAVISAENFLTFEINPETHLDQIIEQVKELYICHHLKDKSFRRTATTCRISRSMIRRIADKFEMNNYQPNL